MANPRPPRHVRVFLASAGDVVDERRAAREVLQQLERAPLVRRDFTIEVVSWDDPDAPVPMLATLTPQQAVVRALPKPSQCDLTVTIVASRIGTPLNERKPDGTFYRSGTEWEFEDARRAGKAVLLYRCLEPRSFPGDEAEARRQREQVDAFFAQFRTVGGTLTGGVTDYRTVGDFARRLRTDVEELLRSLSDLKGSEATHRQQSTNWIGRQQSSVRLWHPGRLALVLLPSLAVSLAAWSAFFVFPTVVYEYDAPLLAYLVRYALAVLGIAVPAVLGILLWWWFVPARQSGTES